MVAYNLFVGGTETAGLGNSANSRGALSTHFFHLLQPQNISCVPPGKAFFPLLPRSPLAGL